LIHVDEDVVGPQATLDGLARDELARMFEQEDEELHRAALEF
jgi:hypothetical protein